MVRARKTRKKDGLDTAQAQTLRAIMGKRIRELRLQKEMTQSDLGATAGITYGHVSLIENGQANITLETLEKISQVLNVSVASLFEYMGVTRQMVLIRDMKGSKGKYRDRAVAA